MKLKVRSSKRGSSKGATDMSHVHEVASELKHTALSEREITGDSDSWHDADLVTSWRVDLLV